MELATVICQVPPVHQNFAAVLGTKSLTNYISILAVLASGKGYLPIHPGLPVNRAVDMLARSGSSILIADAESRNYLHQLVPTLPSGVTIVLPNTDEIESTIDVNDSVTMIHANRITEAGEEMDSSRTWKGKYAYLLFTSGTTGVPKAVPVTHGNLIKYIRFVSHQYNISHLDRFSQISELTFDLSAHDMFVCWSNGGCLVPSGSRSLLNVVSFLNEERITVFLSVPSIITLLERLKALRTGSLPLLRLSLFCGEAFSGRLAARWQMAAPNSIIENLYGPTEATIAISRYPWRGTNPTDESHREPLPLGRVFDDHEILIIDEDGTFNVPGKRGELLLSGPQVTEGYLDDQKTTEAQYITVEGRRWYRTGDIVSKDHEGLLRFHGRHDEQVKVRGYRIELQEVEGAIKELAGTELAYVIPWPVVHGNAHGLVGVVSGKCSANERDILLACRQVLPEYMIPTRILFLESIPLNENGKIDRRAIALMVSDMIGKWASRS